MLHCSAGVGRTGTVSTAVAVLKGIKEGEITKENYLKVIDNIILKGRSDRGPLFVQKVEQYKLIIELAEEELGLRKQHTATAEE